MNQSVVSVNSEELETLIRRVIREEFVRLLQNPIRSLLEDWKQEGPNEPEGDELLLRDALDVLRKHKDNPDAWTDWEAFEEELDQEEAMNELPD
ncbi:hypothetical protein [Desulfonema magnum]|uniref:Uncharacterized protein n=1 Tax=Desulfonema magnum TaxID=45655 RepID=A0A975BMM3_9BACT|nr:hypothetical protein [Desulfonema magnum]QTA88266.1 Uncharacterized protein dnm_043080 [Desulfonema magnum]